MHPLQAILHYAKQRSTIIGHKEVFAPEGCLHHTPLKRWQLFKLQRVMAEIHYRLIGTIHTACILRQKLRIEATEGVKLKAGQQVVCGIGFPNGIECGPELAGRMCKIAIDEEAGFFLHLLEAAGRARK